MKVVRVFDSVCAYVVRSLVE